MNVVTDIRTLRAMEKGGFVKLHPQTGQRVLTIFGDEHKACYVDSVELSFSFRGRRYGRRWASGCFCPFVEDRGLEEAG